MSYNNNGKTFGRLNAEQSSHQQHRGAGRRVQSRRFVVKVNEDNRDRTIAPRSSNFRNAFEEQDDSGKAEGQASASTSMSRFSNPSSSRARNDLTTLKQFTSKFQMIEKRAWRTWPKLLKDLTNFIQSQAELFESNVAGEKNLDELLRNVLAKVYQGRLFSDIVVELVACQCALSRVLNGRLHRSLFKGLFTIYFDGNNKSIDHQATADVEDYRLVILLTIESIVVQSAPGLVNESLYPVQKYLKQALEQTNNVELVLSQARLMLLVTKRFNSYHTNFTEFINLLIGWYLDTSQSTMFCNALNKILIELAFFWRADLTTSLSFLGQFVQVFEKLNTELKTTPGWLTEPAAHLPELNAHLHQMTRVVSAFATIFEQLQLNTLPDNQLLLMVKPDIFLNMMNRLIEVVLALHSVLNLRYFQVFVIESNLAIGLVIETFQSVFRFAEMKSILLRYTDVLFGVLPSTSDRLKATSLNLLATIVQLLDTALPFEFVHAIFSTQNQRLKLSTKDTVQRCYFNLIYSTLRIKNVEILRLAYQSILKYFKMSLTVLYRHRQANDETMTTTGKDIAPTGLSILPMVEIDEMAMAEIFDKLAADDQVSVAATLLNSDFVLLAEVANTQLSIMATFVLRPNFTELVLHHLAADRRIMSWLAEDHAFLHYQLLYLFFTNCSQRHENYIIQSKLADKKWNQKRRAKAPSFSGEPNEQEEVEKAKPEETMTIEYPSHSAGYFEDILKLIGDNLKLPHLSSETTRLCLHWVDDIAASVCSMTTPRSLTASILDAQVFVALVTFVGKYAFAIEADTVRLACSVLKRLLPRLIDQANTGQLASIGQQYAKMVATFKLAIQFNWAATDEQARVAVFTELQAMLTEVPLPAYHHHLRGGLAKTIGHQNVVQSEAFLFPEEVRLALVCLMTRSPSEHFSNVAFKKIVDFILYGKCVGGDASTLSFEWLQRTFFSVFEDDRLKVPSLWRSSARLQFAVNNSSQLDVHKVFAGNNWALLFWACWEVVGFSLENRLKTPLGKPQDTFTKIELVIKAALSEAYNLKPSNATATGPQSAATLLLNSRSHELGGCHTMIVRLRLLLLMMENFDKLIYNAAITLGGGSMRLYQANKLARAFLRKNRRTCAEWINRNRRSIMLLALKIDQPTTVVRHGEELLLTYVADRTFLTVEEIEFILLLMVEAFVRLRSPEVAIGYYHWARHTVGLKLDWIKAAVHEADQHYETALSEYLNILAARGQPEAEIQQQPQLPIGSANTGTTAAAQPAAGTSSMPLNLLSSNKNFICSSYTVSFIQNRIVHCYLGLGQYQQAAKWLAKSNDNLAQTNDIFRANNVDYEYLVQLADYGFGKPKSIGEDPAASQYKWEKAKELQAWDIDTIYHSTQRTMLKASIEFGRNNIDYETYKEKLEKVLKNDIVPVMSSFDLVGVSGEHCLVGDLHKVAIKLNNVLRENKAMSGIGSGGGGGHALGRQTTLVHSLIWTNVAEMVDARLGFDRRLFANKAEMILDAAIVARKNSNLKLAEQLQFEYVRHLPDLPEPVKAIVDDICFDCAAGAERWGEDMDNNNSNKGLLYSLVRTMVTHRVLPSEYPFYLEAANLLQVLGHEGRTEIYQLLMSFTKGIVGHYQEAMKNSEKDDASSCLTPYARHASVLVGKFVECLQNDPSLLFVIPLNEIIKRAPLQLSQFGGQAAGTCSVGKKVPAQLDLVVPTLLDLAARVAPDSSRAWYYCGEWCYRAARRYDETGSSSNGNAGDEVSTTAAAGPNIASTSGKRLEVDGFAHSMYTLATKAFFRHLMISGGGGGEEEMDDEETDGCHQVSAALRLLRLILKYAPELRPVLESGLRCTPSRPWKNITLQLFSRLNHQEAYVRQAIIDLLCRIGRDAPHLVIFPAVAGANVDEPQPDKDEEESTSGEPSATQNGYSILLQHLSEQNQTLVTQTKLLVQELRRITVLWDELWIATLHHNFGEMKKQAEALNAQVDKIKKNENLDDEQKVRIIREHYNIHFRRILYSLETTRLMTSSSSPLGAPETPHESWFQLKFEQPIDALIGMLRSPPDNVLADSLTSAVLNTYQELLLSLRKHSFVTNTNNRLQMADISPKLAALEATLVPLPGHQSGAVRLHKVYKTVSVLHTNTKPKKIVFIGSDGRSHTYLFKGHEDLHLDERVMQFLSVVNKMMKKRGDGASSAGSSATSTSINTTGLGLNNRLAYRARHYSVTPLGNKSGLIQWVEGAQALYHLYKRHLLHRDTVGGEQTPGFGDGKAQAKYLNSGDLFRAKLVERGLSPENRKDWNLETLVSIHQQLSAETPNELIQRELWLGSSNAYDYWRLTGNFITSTAMMSTVGYVLGLGDRHLENILLDLNTGEVIHIDYNVCFEKGKTLRIPEMVPCRLTRNIVTAFGVTGLEGTFRVACEQIMRTLRIGHDTLLTLLEAFIFDPLVDWTTPDHDNEGYVAAIYGGTKFAQLAREGKIISKRQMERENKAAMARLVAMIEAIEKQGTMQEWPKVGEAMDKGDGMISVEETRLEADNEASKQQNSGHAPKMSMNKKNAFAFSVWKTILYKLEGRINEQQPEKRLTVSEQVAGILKEATDVNNLARMFEGWTSWV